jgi:choline dehydrogenase-like flavoprotein
VIPGLLRGKDIREPLELRADAVVIGSGAGGATAARELSLRGFDVVVLEEGDYVDPEEYATLRPSHTFRRMAREAALAAAVGLGETPVVALMAGKCVGGSSVLTGGVCFRIPSEVLAEWEHERGLASMTEAALAPHFVAVEELLNVETVPDAMRSRSAELFAEGAARIGIPMKALRRNTRGCRGEGRCNFGCPHRAKMSVDVSVLPEAGARGARVVAGALAEQILAESGRARGVRGRLLGHDGAARVPFVVRADVVIVACGALHTPLLLRKSGLRSRHLGRHLTLHPSTRIFAVFDERVDGWDGAFQSIYSDALLASDGITFISAFGPPNLLAGGFPGAGPQHRERVRDLPRTAAFGAFIHDDGGGRVRRFLGREPLVTYRMAARDRARLLRAITLLGDMAFAAGAREVLLPIFGAPPARSRGALAVLLHDRGLARRAECVSFHPLGSARMAARAEDGVVNPAGEAWELPGLFVCDGSVLPTSIGVNSQVPIMAVARKIATGIAERRAA